MSKLEEKEARWLVEHGADLLGNGRLERTAVHLASYYERIPVLRLLISTLSYVVRASSYAYSP